MTCRAANSAAVPSSVQMDAFYKAIEDEKKEEKRRNSKQDLRNKFLKVRRGFNFMR